MTENELNEFINTAIQDYERLSDAYQNHEYLTDEVAFLSKTKLVSDNIQKLTDLSQEFYYSNPELAKYLLEGVAMMMPILDEISKRSN